MRQKRQGLIVSAILLVAILVYFKNKSQAPVPETNPESPVEAVVSETAATTTTSTLPSPSQKEAVAPTQKSKAETVVEPSAEVARFRQLAEDTKKAIPLKKDLQAMTTKETHFTPESIQIAAIKIGELAQAIHDDPRLAPEGLNFYRDCAESEDYPNSVRASCLVNHRDLLKSSNLRVQSLEQDSKIPSYVIDLAKQIP